MILKEQPVRTEVTGEVRNGRFKGKTFSSRSSGNDCYIAENKKTKEALIIDPGDNAARIVQIIKEDGVVPVAVLLTHGHFDHAMAAQEVAEQYGIKI